MDEVDQTKGDLLTAWRRKGQLFEKLEVLTTELHKEAQEDFGSTESIVQQQTAKFRRFR